jgi:cytochrome d ubiquinol oxidase subunit I
MRTAESASPLAAPAVAASLVAFVIVYFAVFGMGTWYLLRLMSRPPQPHEPQPANVPAHAAGITPAPALAGQKEKGHV